MPKSFDASFSTGAVLVFIGLAVAWAALTNPALPVIGSGRGALIAVAVIGMAGCTVGGLPQASTVGWTHPVIVLGSILGVAALGIIAAGLFGWDALLRPVAQVMPGNLSASASTEQLAIVALAALILMKWGVGVVWAGLRAMTPA
jgi:hypothetical protein